MKRVHIVGRKNSGKTTLVEDLVRHFTAQGLRVGAIKHTHHQHELDVPGKDSHRHRQAGAAVVGILSPTMTAVFQPHDVGPDSADRYAALEAAMGPCDLVLVEGHLLLPGLKLEVWRAGVEQPPLALEHDSIVALISDDPCRVKVPLIPRSRLEAIAYEVVKLAEMEACHDHLKSGSS